MRLITLASSVASSMVDLCYPRACAACRTGLDDRSHSSQQLCDDCEHEMIKLQLACACEKCGMPMVEPESPCAYCSGKGVAHFDRVIRLGAFRDPLKHLIHRMKYHRSWTIAELLAERLSRQPHVRALLDGADVLVPVPLHATRQIARGYNQAEVIARTLGSKHRVKVVQPLARPKRTPMQTTMTSIANRAENLRGAFELDRPKLIAGKRVVVIDDVMTTGATLRAAAQELSKADPASMAALIVAVADPMNRDFQAI